RRRHTRWPRDWSSDVCSSDLKLRDWVTFYGDAFAEDQFSPIAYWDRSAIRGGLYFSHLPKVQRLDLRVEGVYTDIPAGGALSHRSEERRVGKECRWGSWGVQC